MTRLVVVRHAKSDWPAGVADRDRPLAERGRRDATAAGRWVRDNAGPIDLARCSTAARARQTWDLMAAHLGEPAVRYEDRIHSASAGDLLALVRELPAEAGTVLLVGHNPGLTDLVRLLAGGRPELKTASVAVLGWPGPWADAGPAAASLAALATPRGD